MEFLDNHKEAGKFLYTLLGIMRAGTVEDSSTKRVSKSAYLLFYLWLNFDKVKNEIVSLKKVASYINGSLEQK